MSGVVDGMAPGSRDERRCRALNLTIELEGSDSLDTGRRQRPMMVDPAHASEPDRRPLPSLEGKGEGGRASTIKKQTPSPASALARRPPGGEGTVRGESMDSEPAPGLPGGRLAGGAAYARRLGVGARRSGGAGVLEASGSRGTPEALPLQRRDAPIWTYSDKTSLPGLRLRRGQTLRARLTNALPREGEHVSIHWHGMRLPNAQDGVPYLTQQPVAPGESFTYEFAPPDTGTFFFHTHCNTAEQLGRGLAGVLIVEGDETAPYDAEHVLASSCPIMQRAASARSHQRGCARRHLGTVSCNGLGRCGNLRSGPAMSASAPDIDRTASCSRLEGAEPHRRDRRFACSVPLKRSPGRRPPRRVMRSPTPRAWRARRYFSPSPFPLATCRKWPPSAPSGFAPTPLQPPTPVPTPYLPWPSADLPFSQGDVHSYAPIPRKPTYSGVLLTTLHDAENFWSINKQAWPGRDHKNLPPPIATLERGKSYVFELVNTTPHKHPIHIHGHAFKWLKSNKRDLPVHHADTVLLEPKERVEVAFVADNPGDWMFHCHIIEHQETGMMSYLRVA